MSTGLRAKRKPRQKGDAELLAGGKNVFRGPVAEVVFVPTHAAHTDASRQNPSGKR